MSAGWVLWWFLLLLNSAISIVLIVGFVAAWLSVPRGPKGGVGGDYYLHYRGGDQ